MQLGSLKQENQSLERVSACRNVSSLLKEVLRQSKLKSSP